MIKLIMMTGALGLAVIMTLFVSWANGTDSGSRKIISGDEIEQYFHFQPRKKATAAVFSESLSAENRYIDLFQNGILAELQSKETGKKPGGAAEAK
ncbi:MULTISPECIES: hypothetical protein [Bacillus]|uniref:hypothetical protein n=1 Tax=Bacillus TaxID=1386 RepID=UPI00098B7FD3|nr:MULTISPECIES: hypothetical protein [Bacillus]WFA04207.1 hypothetical protein P3X63_16455 [Bacillus sp. HSf4]